MVTYFFRRKIHLPEWIETIIHQALKPLWGGSLCEPSFALNITHSTKPKTVNNTQFFAIWERLWVTASKTGIAIQDGAQLYSEFGF